MRRGVGRGGLGLGLIGVALGLVGPSAAAQEQASRPEFTVGDLGVVPRPALEGVIVSRAAVRQAINLTEAQRRDRAPKLTPEQQRRVDQIQLQAQGPLAFAKHSFPEAYAGPTLAERLELTDEQVRRLDEVAGPGAQALYAAATFPLGLPAADPPPSDEAIGRYVDSPEFRAAKARAREQGRAAWATLAGQVEAILSDAQRQAYHDLLGPSFDLGSLEDGNAAAERQRDIVLVSRALAGPSPAANLGQRADPDFDTRVARPAYPAAGATHPRVLFDEAHHNFHTSDGRYQPFARLIGSDGYRIIPNREPFTPESLARGEILIVANALGAERMGDAGAGNPAFTEAEADAVRDWVGAGGSLLLITDHAPMGAAAGGLGSRFAVAIGERATADPAHSAEGETSLVFDRAGGLLADHPITRGRTDAERLNRIQTFTGTSLAGPRESFPLLKLADSAVDIDDQGRRTPPAGRVQGLALGFGRGRVVVLGEAAELSAQLVGTKRFGMNVPGVDNRQFALNILHWLSGLLEPTGPGAR